MRSLNNLMKIILRNGLVALVSLVLLPVAGFAGMGESNDNLSPLNKQELEQKQEERQQEAGNLQMIGSLNWYTNYGSAYTEARELQKNMLIVFEDDQRNQHKNFREQVLAQESLVKSLKKYVRVIIPKSEPTPDGKSPLLSHSSFRQMQHQSGIAVLDLSSPGSEHYNRLISAFPVSSGRTWSKSEVQTMLELPEGSITQRTLVYALRRHPEHPRSGYAQAHPYLMQQARSHSSTMARTYSVGHHNWGYRFAQINRVVGPAREVAVSGDGATLLDVANSCIRTWRSSPGHWNIMSQNARYMGYDMKQSANGTWYATGITVQ